MDDRPSGAGEFPVHLEDRLAGAEADRCLVLFILRETQGKLLIQLLPFRRSG